MKNLKPPANAAEDVGNNGSVRLRNALHRVGYGLNQGLSMADLEDVCVKGSLEFKKQKGVGRKTVKELQAFLNKWGMDLMAVEASFYHPNTITKEYSKSWLRKIRNAWGEEFIERMLVELRKEET